MEKHNVDFHIAEYNALQAETQFWFRRSGEIVLYSMFANGFIVAWVSELSVKSGHISPFGLLASLVPLIITISAGLLYWKSVETVYLIEKYCAELEEKFSLSGFGFFEFLNERRQKKLIRSTHIYILLFLLQLILSLHLLILSVRSYHS
jgi:hypothetical protein